MDAQIVIPWRDGPGRRENLDAALAQWEPFGTVTLGASPPGPFNRSAAINAAAAVAVEGDVIVVADADVLVPADQIEHGLQMAAASPAAVLPYREIQLLGKRGTGYARKHGVPVPLSMSIGAWSGNTPIMLSWKCWHRVGGFDEGYVGWGEEDTDFMHQCEARLQLGIIREPGNAWHMWHPAHSTPPELVKANRERLHQRWG